MDGLVQWLRDQLDEDEQVARAAGGGWRELPKNWVSLRSSGVGQAPAHRVALVLDEGERAHIVRHDPARVLRELDAKRRILALYATAIEGRTALRARMREAIEKDSDEFTRLHRQESELLEMAGRMAPVVRLLALPYVDRPGYREEWRP
ncbi:DUF6221 family protein [Streptomyces sp. NBC_01788]|uniref:DUF6221 family protein n=1 Tax=Streptomyces sp. NBC_01788 TaxID=2975940 RepID=UPI002DD9A379|nr:DUF6221 family protein [Streptomyces sp. NBC_01788]WSB30903.1 DUF6221 family protein [Streptomyces sp. NBC_01788]